MADWIDLEQQEFQLDRAQIVLCAVAMDLVDGERFSSGAELGADVFFNRLPAINATISLVCDKLECITTELKNIIDAERSASRSASHN